MIHLGQVQCAVTIIAIVLNLFKSGIENCEIAIQRRYKVFSPSSQAELVVYEL